jgi:molybdate transport system substrate-binding protein
MRFRRGRGTVVVLGLVLAAAGCSSGGSNPAPSGSGNGRLTVFAAASLTEAFTTLGKRFEAAHPGTTVSLDFDASSALATQIAQGKPADVFASASTATMHTVVSSGDATDPTDFVSNTMEIATPPGNPAKIATVADLAKPGVKVALCDPEVPCGATAAEVFAKAHVSVTPVSNEPDVKSTLAKVELKEVDAGLVYVTDVRAAGDKVTGVSIPADLNARTTYPIATLTHSSNSALARAWVDYVLSDAAQNVLRADGFSRP